ncbi:hypothetical protein [Sporosarcina sp. FA9]|uniref:hypothetical protein n=1 Tax=Sporosarcina sp. FA9 TaxID=3413030 RepID=UPI003F656B0C
MKDAVNSLPIDLRPTHPLLIMLPDEVGYHNAEVKLMIVGQETNDWEGMIGRHTVGELQEVYKSFVIENDYSRKSTFWRYMRSWSNLIEEATPNSAVSVVWNNIHKLGRVGAKGKANEEIREIQKKHFAVFEEELKVLKPDIVLFFTGPNCDDALKCYLPGIEFRKIDEGTEKQIVQCEHKSLPKLTYRTYHPGYLNRLSPEKYTFNRNTPIEVIIREMQR